VQTYVQALPFAGWMRESGRTLAVEAGCVKEWDCQGAANRALLPALAAAGASWVSLDEPLVAGVRPFWQHGTPWPSGHCVEKAEAPAVLAAVEQYIGEARRAGLRVNWIEAWPQHPMDWIIEQMTRCHGRPDRVTLDLDPYATVGVTQMHAAVSSMRDWCGERIDLAGIVTGHRAQPHPRDWDFIGRAWRHWEWLRTAGPWDRIVVQSWHPDPAIPQTDTLIRVAMQIDWMEAFSEGV